MWEKTHTCTGRSVLFCCEGRALTTAPPHSLPINQLSPTFLFPVSNAANTTPLYPNFYSIWGISSPNYWGPHLLCSSQQKHGEEQMLINEWTAASATVHLPNPVCVSLVWMYKKINHLEENRPIMSLIILFFCLHQGVTRSLRDRENKRL